jgi:hypothetical protein
MIVVKMVFWYIYQFKIGIVYTSKQILSMSMHRISYFFLFFLLVLSTTGNVENDSNDGIELTSDMWVRSLEE